MRSRAPLVVSFARSLGHFTSFSNLQKLRSLCCCDLARARVVRMRVAPPQLMELSVRDDGSGCGRANGEPADSRAPPGPPQAASIGNPTRRAVPACPPWTSSRSATEPASCQRAAQQRQPGPAAKLWPWRLLFFLCALCQWCERECASARVILAARISQSFSLRPWLCAASPAECARKTSTARPGGGRPALLAGRLESRSLQVATLSNACAPPQTEPNQTCVCVCVTHSAWTLHKRTGGAGICEQAHGRAREGAASLCTGRVCAREGGGNNARRRRRRRRTNKNMEKLCPLVGGAFARRSLLSRSLTVAKIAERTKTNERKTATSFSPSLFLFVR